MRAAISIGEIEKPHALRVLSRESEVCYDRATEIVARRVGTARRTAGREHDDLPVEIHHCRVAAYGEELHRRQALVRALLDRMQVVVEV